MVIDGSKHSRSATSHIALNSVDNALRDEKTCRVRQHIGRVCDH